MTELNLSFPDNRLLMDLCGPFDQNLAQVENALEMLSEKELVDLDEERKAAMVSNLLVVLCGQASPTPVLNTGSLYN